MRTGLLQAPNVAHAAKIRKQFLIAWKIVMSVHPICKTIRADKSSLQCNRVASPNVDLWFAI